MLSKPLLTAIVLASTLITPAITQSQPEIEIAITLDVPVNGVSTTPDGRIFLLYARVDGSSGPQVVEYFADDNSTSPIPNEEWNSFTEDKDPTTHLIRTNSQRIGPDGALWLVDVGSPSFGAPVILPDGPKLVQFNLTTNEVQRVYLVGNATRVNSLLDDVRFNPLSNKAHLTDAGSPGIIVLDLDTGVAVRVLGECSTPGLSLQRFPPPMLFLFYPCLSIINLLLISMHAIIPAEALAPCTLPTTPCPTKTRPPAYPQLTPHSSHRRRPLYTAGLPRVRRGHTGARARRRLPIRVRRPPRSVTERAILLLPTSERGSGTDRNAMARPSILQLVTQHQRRARPVRGAIRTDAVNGRHRHRCTGEHLFLRHGSVGD